MYEPVADPGEGPRGGLHPRSPPPAPALIFGPKRAEKIFLGDRPLATVSMDRMALRSPVHSSLVCLCMLFSNSLFLALPCVGAQNVFSGRNIHEYCQCISLKHAWTLILTNRSLRKCDKDREEVRREIFHTVSSEISF